ncbi:MAG: hypothetical protein A2857_04055 [Candidatus Levybacteria bacterium RIFCSPHIGHO2_01_FULL_36_15]|nr:MAG: hypothetical protein A2857_04055 [Candidatus Levybacteria bacterium RIFCSPHIGHO2_01_FULL_36_15]OGH37443.1 MAG: hypothetical protein A2905_04900 [Candidatus Levybacteria bacterium RIFCSPLOWO2_01_FULL_36_10]
MLNLSSIILFSENPSALANFYKQVFQKDPDWSGGDFVGFKLGTGTLVIGPHDKVHGKNATPERIMFNLETNDVEKEFERIKNIQGTQVVATPYLPGEDPSMTIATLADTDNNYFQLNTPMG